MILRLTPSPVPLWTLRAHLVLDVAMTVPYASDAALLVSACVPGPVASRCLCLEDHSAILSCEFTTELILGFGPTEMRRWACVFRRH
jgi:hypothetical protein